MKGGSNMKENNEHPLTEEEQKQGFNNGSPNMDMILPLLMAVFSNNNTNVPLEKEVSYLSGKVDTLEKIILTKNEK